MPVKPDSVVVQQSNTQEQSEVDMASKVDSVFRTRSLGVAARGVPDQYADGKAARVWHKYIGDQNQRTGYYQEKLLNLLKSHGVKNVFDVACGTGVDSILLVDNGFEVTSVDASDKMLKYALKLRWENRKDERYDKWVIEEGNWLKLNEADIEIPAGGFDCLICMGNSFAHLPDFDGHQRSHHVAFENFYQCLKPGGILVIDHRNYDHIVSGGKPPMKNIYYQSNAKVDVKTSLLMVDNKCTMITLDYTIEDPENGEPAIKRTKDENDADQAQFRLSYYPHVLSSFNKLVETTFGADAPHKILGDFEPQGDVENPAYYIHIIQKK